jgi:Uma2 family endonuclease
MTTMSVLESHEVAPERIRPLRRTEFEKLVALGAFDDERIELLRGALVDMSPTDPTHDRSISELARIFYTKLAGRAYVRVQSSFAASDDSEPVPDVVVAPLVAASWSEHPAEALLVVEVARTSLPKDRGVKAELYGSVTVREYWIVDIERGTVEVLRSPDGNGHWTVRTTHGRGETIRPEAFPDVVVPVADIVPPIA